MVICGTTTKFNSHHYFRLYGILFCPRTSPLRPSKDGSSSLPRLCPVLCLQWRALLPALPEISRYGKRRATPLSIHASQKFQIGESFGGSGGGGCTRIAMCEVIIRRDRDEIGIKILLQGTI